MNSLKNREFAPRIVDLINEVREDYREAYNKTNLEYVCEDLAEELRRSLSYSMPEYSLVNEYLDKLEELESDRDNELERLHEMFLSEFAYYIDCNCLYDMFEDLKDPNGKQIFNYSDPDFDSDILENELEEIMSCPNNLAYELVKDKLDMYFFEVFLYEEAGEWGEAHEYDMLSWAYELLTDYIRMLSPEEEEFMKNMREGGDK